MQGFKPVPHDVPHCPFDHHALDDTEAAWGSYEGLRNEGVVFSPEHGGFYVLARYEHVLAALRDPDTFVSGQGTRIPAVGDGRIIPLDFDPPSHTAYRALISEQIRPDAVRGMTAGLRELIDELIDNFHASGGGDWVTAVGLPLPLNVLVQVVGFAPETVDQFRDLTAQSWKHIREKGLIEARAGLFGLIREEVRRHRESRPDDYITSLLDKEIDGRPISDDELERLLLAFAVAGHETTMNASGSMLRYLVEDPARQARLREQPELIPAFVEETLRFSTPVQTIGRYTARDIEIGGVTIPADSRVLLVFAGANRDPNRFDHADGHDMNRSAAGHLAFGFGRHQCAGALLARTELRLILEKLITMPDVEYAGEPVFGGLEGGSMSGPSYLPLRFATSPRATIQEH